MRNKRYRCIRLLTSCLMLAGCAASRPVEGPAGQYLPDPVDMPGYLVESSNRGLEHVVEQTPVRALPEDSAYINFDNEGYSYTTEPQNGVYLRLAYWVVIHRNTADAISFYRNSNTEHEQRDRLTAIMPSAVQQTVEDIYPVALAVSACQESSLYKIPSHVIFTPDLYLYALCRVENAVISLWAYTPNNYDGSNSPIPDEIISAQMADWMGLALDRMENGGQVIIN